MKKLNVLAVAFLVFLSITVNAAALDSKSMTRQDSASAYASWSEGSSNTYLYVSETNDDTYINVQICGEFSCTYGDMYTQEDVLDVSRKLNKATLSPVDIIIYDYNTGIYEEITIQAEWTGVGEVFKSSSHSISKFGDMTFKYSDSTQSRDATATGTINGNDLGLSNYAGLYLSKYVSMTMEK